MIVVDVLIIVLLFALFGTIHTILSSNKVKKRIAERIGIQIAYYRMFYNVLSLIIFVFIYNVAPQPDFVVYDLHAPYDIIMVGVQTVALFGLLWSVMGVNGMEFAGISQIVRYYNNSYDVKDLDAKEELRVKGAAKYSRHPIYFFSILFLGFRPAMDLFYLVMFLCITLYFYIGSYYEEKKLVEKFGDAYREYQNKVPRIVPIKFSIKK